MINDNYKYNAKIKMRDDNSSFVKILKRIPLKSKVLEFGPAYGYMTKYMTEELLCKVTCVELDPQAAEQAKAYCKRMIIGDIEKLSFETTFNDEKFDVITFGDVLEHLYDPWRIIKNCQNILKEDGKILVSIPNISHLSVILNLIRGKFDYTNSGILDNTHIRFFTKESVLQMFLENYYYATIVDRVKNSETSLNGIFSTKEIINLVNKYNSEYDTYQFIVEAKKINYTLKKQMKDLENKLHKKEKELELYEKKFNRVNIITKAFLMPHKAVKRLLNKILNK